MPNTACMRSLRAHIHNVLLGLDPLLCHHDQNQVGDTAGAIQHYELAGTHCVEVPRMLFERGRVEDLEEYITQVPSHNSAMSRLLSRPLFYLFPRPTLAAHP